MAGLPTPQRTPSLRARRGSYLVSVEPPSARHSPLVLWHLLSLDAPTVAALWTWFFARANRIPLSVPAVVAMAVAVWLLYAADRLLDARETGDALEARHHFHHRHRTAFLIGIALASTLLALLLPCLAPEAIHLYLIEGGFLVGYFVLIHATRSSHRLPKELAVGLFFAAATFIPTIAHAPSLRLPLLLPAFLFAALCSLNCLFIYAWEHVAKSRATAHPATQLALRHLRSLALALTVAASLTCRFDHRVPWPIPAAIATAAAALLLLNRTRNTLAANTLRAAADLALLTPLLFLLAR